MSSPYLAELRLISFNYAPRGWVFANGQTMAINQNQALFSLCGTTYGGNGQTTFLLPNLQGKVALHMGSGYVLGQTAGEVNHTLNASEMPQHLHFLEGCNAAENSPTPAGHLLANTTGNLGIYGPATNLTATAAADIANIGGGQPHSNQSPYLVMNWIVCLQGIFPSQT